MAESKLDVYKEHYNCEFDGEAVLKAANMGMFSEDSSLKTPLKNGVFVRKSTAEQLRKLGVTPDMPRNKIINKMKDHLESKGNKVLDEMARHELELIRPHTDELLYNVRPFPGLEMSYREKAIVEIARIRVKNLIIDVKSFCKDGL